MNKQEAIKRVEQTGEYESFVDEPISKKSVLAIISQIDESQKVVVPQFVADWYEENKYDFEKSIFELCIDFRKRDLQDDLHEWFSADVNKPIETLVKMKLFGYEIEKEKLYTAMLKISGEYLRLNYGAFSHLKVDRKYILDGTRGHRFTEDDLVKYHIWGNDNYEVKEVEE